MPSKPLNVDFTDDDIWGEAKRWCSFIHETSEPKVIIHNRIPQSGSYQMQKVLNSRRRSSNDIMTMNHMFMTDYDKHLDVRRKVVTLINNHLSKSNHVIVNGYWKHSYFTKNDFNQNRVESIQLFRDCKFRRYHIIQVTLNHTTSTKAKEIKVLEWERKVRQANLPLNETEYCYNGFQCMRKTNFGEVVGSYPSELHHVCGHNCTEKYGSIDVGAYYNLHNPNVFSVVGTLKNFDQFLEMLECAYPTRLEGITKSVYHVDAQAIEAHLGQIPPRIDQVLWRACNSKTNPYQNIYLEVAQLSQRRYRYMKQNKQRCCRTKIDYRIFKKGEDDGIKYVDGDNTSETEFFN